MGYIYLVTNTLNNKKYVGQTVQDDVTKRWNQHKSTKYKGVGICLSSAYEKYGISNFNFQLICICFDEDCNRFEEEYINKFNTIAPNGYNLRAGGMNSKQHPDTILQRVETRLKNKLANPKPPRVMTEEERKRLSVSLSGARNPNFGKETPVAIKKILSDTMKARWKDMKEKNIVPNINSRFVKGHISENRKPVGKYDLEGNFIERYESAVEAGEKNNIHHAGIAKVCRGVKRYKTAGGFVWKFIAQI